MRRVPLAGLYFSEGQGRLRVHLLHRPRRQLLLAADLLSAHGIGGAQGGVALGHLVEGLAQGIGVYVTAQAAGV